MIVSVSLLLNLYTVLLLKIYDQRSQLDILIKDVIISRNIAFERVKCLKKRCVKVLKKYHNKGGKEKASKYYKDNKEAIKKARNKYKNLTKEEKELKRQYSRNRYYKLKQQYKV